MITVPTDNRISAMITLCQHSIPGGRWHKSQEKVAWLKCANGVAGMIILCQ